MFKGCVTMGGVLHNWKCHIHILVPYKDIVMSGRFDAELTSLTHIGSCSATISDLVL
jgi:hypothetical protein